MSRFGDWIRGLSSKKGATASSASGIGAQNNPTSDKKFSFGDWIRKKREDQQNGLYNKYNERWGVERGANTREIWEKVKGMEDYAALRMYAWDAVAFSSAVILPLILLWPYIFERSSSYKLGEYLGYQVMPSDICYNLANDEKLFWSVNEYKRLDKYLQRRHDGRRHFWGNRKEGIALYRVLRNNFADPLMVRLRAEYKEQFELAEKSLERYKVHKKDVDEINTKLGKAKLTWPQKQILNPCIVNLGKEETTKHLTDLRYSACRASECAGQYNEIFFERFKRTKGSDRKDDIQFREWFIYQWNEGQSKETDQEFDEDTVESNIKEAESTAKRMCEASMLNGNRWSGYFDDIRSRNKNNGTLEQMNEAMEDWKKSEGAKKFGKMEENAL